MFNFNARETPLIMLVACPICVRQHEEHRCQRIAYQQRALCPAHRAQFESMLRNPTLPRLAIRLWLNLLRSVAEPL